MALSSLEAEGWLRHSQMNPYHASTPPPEDDETTQDLLMNGIGCHFPSNSPSRASSLTVDGESVLNHPATPRRGSADGDASGSDDNITPTATALETVLAITPTKRGPPQAAVRASMPMFSNCLLTPSPSPRVKRGASPPATPQPVKRPRSRAQQARSDTHSDEPGAWQAFRNARQLTAELAESASLLARTPMTSMEAIARAQAPRHAEACSPAVNRALFEDPAEGEGEHEFLHSTASLANSNRGRKYTSIIPIQYSLDKDEFTLELHWFTEEEIEKQLAKLLRSYRRFYAAPDDLEDEASAADGDASQAATARDALKTIFIGRLDLVLEGDESQDGNEGKDFLLLQEEEDVLNTFMMWIREMAIPSHAHVEVIQDMQGCIGRLMQLTVEPARPEGSQKTAAFIKKIT
ncbi:hypothetical protein B0T26DRAFT_72633 [Lasiosphaeria miniovina]|uniref:Uncharacterized protein n=1 Tax=Lasiosphaeria miniovina TaxID=1954250 RepID=A0AA40BHR1_9PEZI|nr:uncharacterized protein B0T26DRAFT_72633 [Lasiosphaeria miniovina]KAK0734460.1 hypothetical protein B0T26DRAFT_72633 [Lasiosphaeria miniovina]